MKMNKLAACVAAVLGMAVPVLVCGQQSTASNVTVAVPRLVNVSGEYHPKDGGSAVPLETVTLRIYAQASGGVPLWQETQTVAVDPYGFYTVVLGATQQDGIPPNVFASSGAQWLGMAWARDGSVEGARSRLTSVPYALRAADAETLGGLPASAYQLAPNAPRAGANMQPVYTVPMGAIAMPNVNAAADIAGASPPTSGAPKALLGGSANFLAKYYNGADVGASAIYEINGFTGFNTTTPQDIIHSRFTNGDGTLTGLAVQNLGNNPLSYSGMLFYDQNGQVAQFQGFGNVTHEYRINNVASGATINFMTGGISRLLVDSSGRIGIGTTPTVTFDVAHKGFGDAHFGSYVENSVGTWVDGYHARGTMAAPTALHSGDEIVSFGAGSYNGSDFSRPAFIQFTASEAQTPDTIGSDILFFNTSNGTNTISARMIIHNSGSVGIGNGGVAPLDKLQVVGDIRVGTTGTNGCIKNFAGTGIVGTCSSDARLKQDIHGFEPVLDRVAALRPVHFTWRADEFPQRHYGKDPAYGLIAQEVEKVLPEMVVTQDDGMKAVDYSELPLLAIQAIKELKQRVAELEATVEQLRKK